MVLASGAASIDGHNVFILLAPTVVGQRQVVEFKVTITPLGADGEPDLSMLAEIKEATVLVYVSG